MLRQLLIISTFLFILVSCGKKQSGNVKLKMHSAIAAAGIDMPGGIVLYGHNNTTSEDVAIEFGENQSNIILEYGEWDIFVVGWNGPNTVEGTMYCGGAALNIDSSEATLELTISNDLCTNPGANEQKFITATNYLNLSLNSCINLTGDCTSNVGSVRSYSVSLITSKSDAEGNLTPSSLDSICYDVSLGTGETSGIAIPYGDAPLSNFDLKINTFASTGCSGETEVFLVEDGLSNFANAISSSGSGEVAVSNTGSSIVVYTKTPSISYTDSFISIWEFPVANHTLDLPLAGGFNYNFTVDWGDGSTSTVTSFSDANKSHTYTAAGTYTVTIQGLVEAINSASNTSANYLIEVPNLGDMGWLSFYKAFYYCQNLTTVSGGDTSSVTNMSSMFSGAVVATPDTSGWDTSAVTSMGYMFSEASTANPDTSGWDTSSVTNMIGMFQGASVATPDTNGWDTSAVTDMSKMFQGASVANPDTSGWDTSAVTDMSGMFYNAYVATPDTSGWNTSAVTDINGMFRGASVANPDVSGWDTSSVTDMSIMFSGASAANPDVSGWDTSSVTDMRNMFAGSSVANPDTSVWDTSAVTDMSGMFYYASIANPDTSGWDTSSVTDMRSMFYYASIASPDTSGWDTSAVTNMSNMFYYASIANPDTSGWDTSAVTDMSSMFYRASYAMPETGTWNTSSVTNMSRMFQSAHNANPDVSNWDTSSVTNMTSMFWNAFDARPDVTNWDTSLVTGMEYIFKETNSDINLSNWDFSNVTDIGEGFNGLNLSSANYTNLLISLDATLPVSTTTEIDVGTTTYDAAAATARANLIANGWTIVDGGQTP